MAPDAPPPPEEVDLDPKTQSYLLEVHGRLKTLTHYEILGIPRDADRKEVKRAYYEAIAMIHPDRYFGKKLGSFKSKMEQVFTRLTEAQDVLSARDKRAAYDAKLGPVAAGTTPSTAASPSSPGAPAKPAPAPPAAVPRAPVDPRVAAKRQAAMDALRQRHADGRGKAQQFAEAGRRARANRDFAAAAEAFKTALLYAPDDATLKAAHAEAERSAEERLVESHRRQALLEERHGHWAEASESWKRVLKARPGDHEAMDRFNLAVSRAATKGS